MGRRKKTPLLKRLFPYSPFLRILFVIVVMSTVYIAGYSMYHFYEIKVQEARLTEEETPFGNAGSAAGKEKDLEDPSVIEKRQGKIWGLSRNGRFPISSKFFMQIFYRFYNCLYCTPK